MTTANEPVFVNETMLWSVERDDYVPSPAPGLTKREYFAAMFMTAMLADLQNARNMFGVIESGKLADKCSQTAIECADSFIKTLNR